MAAIVGAVSIVPRDGPAPARVGAAEVEPPPAALTEDSDAPAAPRPTARSHLALQAGPGERFQALAVAGPRGPRLFVAAPALQGAAPLRAVEPGIGLLVVHVDPNAGYGLLEPTGAWPDAIEPLPTSAAPGDGSAGFAVLTADGSARAAVTVSGPGIDGRLQVTPGLPSGTAVLDAAGRAFAYVVDEAGAALPLGPAIAWLDQPGRQTTEEARVSLRARDPRALLEDATEILAEGDPDLSDGRRALDLLIAAERAATDRDLLDRIRSVRRLALADVVERESQVDAVAALARGRDGIAQYGDDPQLLASTVRAAVRAGDPTTALDLLGRLHALEPEAANRVLASIERAILAWIETSNAPAEAVVVADRLLAFAPSRAALVAARATALEAAGRPADAATAAQRAAALDPRFAALAERLTAAATAPADGVVRIPYDPRSGSILAAVQLGDRTVRMVVDTGATLTTIPTALAAQLGLLGASGREIQVETVNGTVSGRSIRIPRMRIGSLELTDVRAVALDLPGTLAGQGLLGLSALRQMDVRLDAEAGEIVLERRKRR